MESGKQFEVHCLHCDVSYPVGTKQCIHCGNRIGTRSVLSLARGARDFTVPTDDEEPFSVRGFTPRPMEDAEPAEIAEDSSRRSPFRIGMSVIWLVVLAIGMLGRMCTEGGG